MTDALDEAQAVEERERDASIALARAPVMQRRAMPAAEDCRHCDDPIDEARREALPGVQTCVECQASRERLRKLFGKSR